MLYALALTLVSARLSAETDFLNALGLANPPALGTGCIKTGQCYVGNDPATHCCDGHAIATPSSALSCSEGLTCSACKMAVKSIVGALTKQACLAIIPSGDVTCEVLGFGPEDPLADICVAIVSVGCPIVSKLVSRGIKDPFDICVKMDWCSENGGQPNGRTFGTECGCVASGRCTAQEAGCCSGKTWPASFFNPNHCYYTGGLKECK